ncbi:type I restriction endonuclease [Halobacillus sp. A5]|uniref:type I restriction endonuclease n=1 Tax=Halobacillus sp. A5 TaxID=2880263 RepID=UPI0020A6D9A8|nr:type I restriction endonuclease [Halobacillus sp. A5]MCP3026647.1 type I restriction enzyme HsdR N-terminal domain-containing protein [Halobacillus sp. A5]
MSDFNEKVRALSDRVDKMRGNIHTEEATKTSIIMPFFQILGYDVFNPAEFTPEYTADVGIKKGEKVDYAIMHEGEPLILIEAKSLDDVLTKHDSQLFRYFGTTKAKFAILTNGVSYKFFTDLEEQNKMDVSPFFTFDLLDLKDSNLSELSKFRKDSFDLAKIFNTASELKYTGKIKELLYDLWEEPTEDFIHYILNNIYEGRKTKNVVTQFEPIVKKSFKQFINEIVNDKLSAALKSTNNEDSNVDPEAIEETEEIVDDPPEIITTEEEIQGYAIARLILSESIDEERVYYRDNKSYFNILIDDNIRRWVCRLGLNSENNKYIQFNDEERTTVSIERVSELTKYKEKLLKVTESFK